MPKCLLLNCHPQDTESFYTVVQQKILDRFGKKFTWEIKSRMMGRKAMDAAKTLIEHFGLGDELKAEDFVEERERMLDELFPGKCSTVLSVISLLGSVLQFVTIVEH